MSPRSNCLLSDLPAAEYEAFTRHLTWVFLRKGQVLFDVGEIPRHVYYPVGAVVSMMQDSRDGEPLETYMLGKTCMVGVAAVGQPSFYRAQVRSSGPAYQLPVSTLRQLRGQCPTYFQRAAEEVNRVIMQMSQALVCSRHHGLDQQLTRWLLMTLDRSTDACIQITHRELSELLGVRREAVTLTLKTMAERGDVAVRRGVIEVLDRQALEERSCECYWLGQQRARSPDLSLSPAV